MTLKEILEWVIKHYPDSCIACNARNESCTYDDETFYGRPIEDELFSFFAYELIGICGCGMPEKAMIQVRNYLRCVSDHFDWDKREAEFQKYFGCTSVYDNPLLLFMAYILDEKELTEHGSGIGGAWISELGKMCLTVLEACDLGDTNGVEHPYN